MTGNIPISDVVNVSVSLTPTGLPNFNVNNMILITSDPFLVNPNSDLIRGYTDSNTIGEDVGFATETYEQGEEVFAQQLNILAGGGTLFVAQFQQGAIGTIAINNPGTGYKVGDSINIILGGGVGGTATVTTVNGSGAVTGLVISNVGYGYTVVSANATTGGFGTGLTVDIDTVAQESLLQAVIRCRTYQYFNGVIATDYGVSSTWVALATGIQAMGGSCVALPTNALADLTGALLSVKNAGLYVGRGLYNTVSALQARLYAAAYMSWALSTNYNGSNTTITMNLKQLIGIDPDPGMTETLKQLCYANGIDTYVNYGGSFPGVVSSGANKFMDEVTNIIWLALALQVAGFDALATVQTKVPYTDEGISTLVAAYTIVMTQAVTNGFLAPGAWDSSYTFGNQADFLNNISQYGFYIYALPVAQVQANIKANRIAPVIQIAGLEADAVQQSNVVVSINP